MTDTPIDLDPADLECSAPDCTSPASRVLGFWTTLPWPLQYAGGQWCLPVCDQHATDPTAQATP